jgi:hypothetical protein
MNLGCLRKSSTEDNDYWVGNDKRKIYIKMFNGKLKRRNLKARIPNTKTNLWTIKIENQYYSEVGITHRFCLLRDRD